MSAALAAASLLLAVMLAVAVCNFLTAPRLGRARGPVAARVSVLVPARDEERNLRELLPLLLAQDHPALEVLVLDDASRDGTARVAAAHAGERLRLLRGAPLPPGWGGKNWACHQLAEAATGELLLFCDADVRPRADAVRRSAALLRAHAAGALTALPRPRTGSWAERAVVPLVAQLPALAMLPLRLVTATRAPSLSMANGQWLLLTRGAYRGSGGHAAVRAEVVEDVALGRRVKAAGERLVVAVGGNVLAVRMYSGWREVRAGFGKNLYPLLGGRPLPFAVGVAAWVLVALLPWAAPLLGAEGAWLPLGLLLAVRAVAAATAGHGVGTVLLHPLGALMALWIALESALGHRRGTLGWKGRSLPAAGSPVATSCRQPS